MPFSDKDLRNLNRTFRADHNLLLQTPEGLEIQEQAHSFSLEVQMLHTDIVTHMVPSDGASPAIEGSSVVKWMTQLPEQLLDVENAPLLEIDNLTPKTRERTISDGLNVLTVGAVSLLGGGSLGKSELIEKSPAAIVQVAFGSDKISKTLRDNLIDRKWPLLPNVGGVDPKKLQEWLRAGALNNLLRRFGQWGSRARARRDAAFHWMTQVRPIGRIVALSPNRGCKGQPLVVRFDLLGSPPSPDILLAIPTRTGCTHFKFSTLAPHLLDALAQNLLDGKEGSKKDEISVTLPVTLPEDVTSGAVGLFYAPPPLDPQSEFGEVGELVGAAEEYRSMLVAELGAVGWHLAGPIVDLATALEAPPMMQKLPCAQPQTPGLENMLSAGPPVIHEFRALENGPVYPRGTLTLLWDVENADDVAISVRTAPHSENPHELPHQRVLLSGLKGQVNWRVPCKTRWEATVVLEASNGNGCVAAGSVTSEINVRSGYSDWLVGVAKQDITDRRPELPMAGFAYERQKSSGQVQTDEHGNEVPLYARAFYIRENRIDDTGREPRELCVVVADLWTATIAMKTKVLERLNALYGTKSRWNEANLLIAGTHTHSAPGGYSEYGLYTLTNRGFDEGVFETVVQGIVNAVSAAATRARPGRIYANQGELADCGENRAMEASKRNPGFNPHDRRFWSDRDMLLLKFVIDLDNRGRQRPLGALNWYALHPTSLGMFNRTISGDSKGWAEMLFEREMAQHGASDFVAAFGNAAAGDVSSTVKLDDTGHKTYRVPLGGPRPIAITWPPLITNPADADIDLQNMRELGQRQFDHAFALYERATVELTGRIDMRHSFIDMSNVHIDGVPNARTWPAMLGISFGAGSTEDSIAYVSFGPADVDPGIPDGMTRTRQAESLALLWGLLAAQVLVSPPAAALALAVFYRTVPALATLPGIFPILVFLTNPGVRAVAASGLASCLLPGQIPPVPADPDGVYSWEVPHPQDVGQDIVAGHGVKPIMFAVGLAKLRCKPGQGKPERLIDCPLVPQVLPMQLLRIGSLAVAAVPAEFTSQAGRRLKETVRSAFGPGLTHVVLSGYSNGYSGYVTTKEEYQEQYYEGASTMFGEYTLDAYQQNFKGLAAAMLAGTEVPKTEPFTVPRKAMRL